MKWCESIVIHEDSQAFLGGVKELRDDNVLRGFEQRERE